MRWIRRAAVVAAFAAAVGMARNAAHADGSSPPGAPTGTIYFQDLSTLDAATNTVVLYSMDPDGGSKTAVLRTDRYVRPSRILHGSARPARWFLTMKTIEGAEIGGNPRRDVYAVRDDGAEVRLTSDPTTEYWMPDWAFSGDAIVSVLGRRWTSTAPDATVVPRTAGLYLLDVLFDADGSGIETVRAPQLWTLFFDATVGDREGRDSASYFSSLWRDTPDVAAYSWSRDGILAVQDLDARTPRIRILDFSVGDEGFDPSQRWEGQDPNCAPGEGLRIAYARFVPAEGTGTDTWVIETADYSRIDRFTTEACVPHPANAATTQSLGRPKFAPDGNDIAYQLRRNGKGTTNYILREPGLGPKDLTPGVKPAAAGETGMVLVDWR